MTSSRLEEDEPEFEEPEFDEPGSDEPGSDEPGSDEPESDDQGPIYNSPLNSKEAIMNTDDIDISDSTLLTSPCSSSKTHSSHRSREFSIRFNDKHQIIEIDCEYTEEQVVQLWFTKEEYDDFLQACDEDAQKCEAHEKETRVNKIKKEIRRQRRQRRKEEMRLHKGNQSEGLDESMNSMALDMENDTIIDDDEDDEINESIREYNENEEGWLCSLGLEAWTLEGYKTREHHRQKAIDAVLNEQYAAWDRGMVENMEMMSALYFAASATSKHDAGKKGRQLQESVQEDTVVSTLEDYKKAVQNLNVLQKSLSCIKGKNKGRNIKLNFNTGTNAKRRGSNDSATSSIGAASSIIDRALALTQSSQDQAPQLPVKSTSSHPPLSSSSSSRKKFKQRKDSGTSQNIYKSKAATNIIFAPPTPPVTKKRAIVYKPSHGGPPKVDSRDSQVTKSPKSIESLKHNRTLDSSKSPKNRKIIYKPIVGGLQQLDSALVTGNDPKTKKKKKKRDPQNQKELKREVKKEKHHSRTQQKREKSRSKSPRPKSLSRSKSPHASRSKSPRPKSLRSSESSRPRSSESPRPRSRIRSNKVVVNKIPDKIPTKTSHSASTDSTTNTNSASSHQNNKKEHWWFQQQKQAACQ